MSSFYVAFCSIARKFAFMNSTVTIKPYKGHPLYKYRVSYPEGTKRRSKGFKLKKDAESWANEKRTEIACYGAKHELITDDERSAVTTFRDYAASVPENIRPSISDALTFYIKHSKMRETSLTCLDIADKLLLRIDKEGKGKRHLDDVTSRLNRFTEDYGDWMACDVSTEIIDEFLDGLRVANQTKLNYRNKVNQLFIYAVKIGACERNPVEDAIKPKAVGSDIGILTSKQIAALLDAASDDIIPGLAIGFFAGLRESEIQRLDWKDVDLEEGHIQISAKNAKSAQRRIVKISENLKAWLLPFEQKEGRVVGDVTWRWRTGKELAREAAGIKKWPPNGARHSFASYHLAEYEDAGKTALELGHSNQRIIFQHYRQIVKPKEAHTYWSIIPEAADNINNIKAS